MMWWWRFGVYAWQRFLFLARVFVFVLHAKSSPWLGSSYVLCL
jgi:hypothetical protein